MLHLHAQSIAITVFMICGAALLSLLARGDVSGSSKIPVAPDLVAKPFLTPREEAMLSAIERLLPNHRIHAQVAMGALLQPPRHQGRRSNPADRNRFSQKMVDFVIQDRRSGTVVALVEVDDHRHVTRRDQARDVMTAAAGYTTIRIEASATAAPANVRLALAPILQASSAGSSVAQS